MSKIRTRRILASICAAVLAPLGLITVAATPAQAELQARYAEVCPDYAPQHDKDLYIRNSNNAILGVVIIGQWWEKGRVCVATIKYDPVERSTLAGVSNDGEVHVDSGDYTRYAGEECTSPRPAKCSAIHARDDGVTYWGTVAGYSEGGTYVWR
jgi:hypothetical protein